MNALQVKEVAKAYERDLCNICQEEDGYNERKIEDQWNVIEKAIIKATENNLPKRKWGQRKEWLDEECKKEIAKRRKLRLTYLNTQNDKNKENYQYQRAKTKKNMQKEKETTLPKQAERNGGKV